MRRELWYKRRDSKIMENHERPFSNRILDIMTTGRFEMRFENGSHIWSGVYWNLHEASFPLNWRARYVHNLTRTPPFGVVNFKPNQWSFQGNQSLSQMHGNGGGAALGQRGLCTFRSRSLAPCHVGESWFRRATMKKLLCKAKFCGKLSCPVILKFRVLSLFSSQLKASLALLRPSETKQFFAKNNFFV